MIEYQVHEELSSYAAKIKTREDIIDLDVVTFSGRMPFYLVALVGDNDEATVWVAALDTDEPSTMGFLDNLADSGQL